MLPVSVILPPLLTLSSQKLFNPKAIPLRTIYTNMFKAKQKQSGTVVPKNSTISSGSKKDQFVVLSTPVKGASDKKEYRVIRLQNGLTACLISDLTSKLHTTNHESDTESEYETESEYSTGESESESSASEGELGGSKMKKVSQNGTKMAAAALSIGVGSFSDPKEIPGLAHFLEHMVFMGSEKYPRENDFDAFIKKRGGTDNASTDCEVTTFYFETMDKHLKSSLDRFAQFFISPLMKKESMTRERESIESEFQMAVPSDTYKKEQLLMSLFNPEVPIPTFSWGNLKTLKDNVNDDELYEKLHDFRRRHYSAHRMTVAIQGRFTLDYLQSYIIDAFSQVPSNNLPADDFRQYSSKIFNTPEFRKIYYVEPIKDVAQLDITWPMPSLFYAYKTKPHQYVSWLLGHEGKGSLLSYLKKNLWALSVVSGNDDSGSSHNSMYSLFSMNIALTKEGVYHLADVIDAVYSYIRMMRNETPQRRIYDEMKLVEDVSFKFREEEDSADFVERMSENMHVFPPEDYLTGPELYFEYDPKGIEMVMEYLNVDNMNIMVSTAVLPDGKKFDKLEPWFNTKYTVLDIPSEWKLRWKSTEPYPQVHLPEENPFLTSDYTILPELSPKMDKPKKIIDTPSLEIWYKKDDKFRFPVARYSYLLANPMTMESPLAACLTDMFVALFDLQVTEEIYPATSAELDYTVSVSDKGIVIRFSGYNEKLHILGDLIARYLKNVAENATAELVSAVKEKQLKSYHNKILKPNNLAKDIRLSILHKGHWTVTEKHAALFDVTFAMVDEFAKNIVKSFHIIGLIQGNVTEERARMTTESIVNILGCQLLPATVIPKAQIYQLPLSESCVRLKSFNCNDSNSIITNYYQCNSHRGLKLYVLIEIVMMIIEERAFDILRTKEQLGYNVYVTTRDTFGVLGFSITVNAQATKNKPGFIDSRIEAFLRYMNRFIKKMPDSKMNQFKRDLIKLKRMVDTEMEEEAERNFGEIYTRQYMFDRDEQEANMIEELKNKEIKGFIEQFTAVGNKANLRKLSVQIVGHDVDSERHDESAPRSALDSSKRSSNLQKQKYTIDLIGNLDKESTPDVYFIKNIKQYQGNCTLVQGDY